MAAGRQGWWEEAGARNVCGEAHALTAVSQLRPLGTYAVRLYFAVGRRFPALGQKLRDLSFIHAARWTIVEKLPGHGRLRSPLLLFESNFNGDWAQYIDAFAYVIPERMALVWWTSWGWPGARPAGPFKEYIRRNEHVASHYYSAYPEATVTEILAALRLQEAYADFERRAADLASGEFDRAWTAFVTEAQAWL